MPLDSYKHIEALCESQYTWRSENLRLTLYRSPDGGDPVEVDLMTWMNEVPDPVLHFHNFDQVRKLCACAHITGYSVILLPCAHAHELIFCVCQ